MSKTVYIHIPFCPKVCHYCDFAVLKASSLVHEQWFEAFQVEVLTKLEGGFAAIPRRGTSLDTLYFGGGTPSLLSTDLWTRLFKFINEIWDLSKLREMTVEVNPESLSLDKIELWRAKGVTRISMGVQSFDNEVLELLGRAYQVTILEQSLTLLQNSGLQFSLDLMFGLPGQSLKGFLSDLQRIVDVQPDHVSFYGLTIEENTLFDQWRQKGKLAEPLDDEDLMYEQGVQLLLENNINRYELSNFSQPGSEAIHNTKYWNQEAYVGLGPGAHSYDGNVRTWNPKKLMEWMREVSTLGTDLKSQETLSPKDQLNELIWLSLRQVKGLNLGLEINFEFGGDVKSDDLPKIKTMKNYLDSKQESVDKFKDQQMLKVENNHLKLTGRGWLMMDEIAIELFVA